MCIIFHWNVNKLEFHPNSSWKRVIEPSFLLNDDSDGDNCRTNTQLGEKIESKSKMFNELFIESLHLVFYFNFFFFSRINDHFSVFFLSLLKLVSIYLKRDTFADPSRLYDFVKKELTFLNCSKYQYIIKLFLPVFFEWIVGVSI